jgi:hypothetical protein
MGDFTPHEGRMTQSWHAREAGNAQTNEFSAGCKSFQIMRLTTFPVKLADTDYFGNRRAPCRGQRWRQL